MHRALATPGLGLLSLLFVYACISPIGAADITIGDVRTIEFAPVEGRTDLLPSVTVVESDGEVLRLQFDLPALQTQEMNIEGEVYHALDIEGGGHRGSEGEPMLPIFSRLIQIPAEAGVVIEVTGTEKHELTGFRPAPLQPDDRAETFVVNAEAYTRSGYTAGEAAIIGEPAIARDLRVVPITFQPVRYDPAQGRLEVASRVEVEVRFAGQDLRAVKQRHHQTIPPSFDRLYRNVVVNYEGPREGQTIAPGSYVIICPNNSTVINKLQPLVEWRMRKGADVYLATTSETGTSRSAIQSWLRSAYTSWENPPEFITLVGDMEGSVAIPCWYWDVSWYSGGTDHPYVQLDGSDLLADAHIGRISVGSTAQLELYITKIVGYESTPYMSDTSWYTRGCVVGDPSDSGITTVQSMQWLKNRLLEIGYTEVDTVFSYPWVSQMVSRLSRGDTVFGYRGYYGMSGFDNDDIYDIENGWKMSFGTFLTCGTGSFAAGTSRSEAWIRAGSTTYMIPSAGIAGVGTATTGTHTRYNNCMTYGIWRGALWEEAYEFGAAVTRGKYELYLNYGSHDYTNAQTFTHWNNLMGDSAGELWTGVPAALQVAHPSVVARGANAVSVSVTAGGSPCADACVCLWKGEETHAVGYTDASGSVLLPVNTPTDGEMLVTVTKHDHHPYLGALDVQQETYFVGYEAHQLDDDTSGSSNGNGDGLLNPAETIELRVQAHNYGTQTATNVTGTISSSDPYVTIIDADETFGTLGSGASAWCEDDFDIEIAGGAPSGHVIDLQMVLADGSHTWESIMQIPVTAAYFNYGNTQLLSGFGAQVDPGESGTIAVGVKNAGNASATNAVGTLSSESPWVTVTDPIGTYGTINPSQNGSNTGDPFGISAASECYQGHVASMQLVMDFSDGARDTVHFVIAVGTAQDDDPTGPDTYGYYAFDNTDTAYEHAPTYNWIEIDPNYGGSGSSVGLTDFSYGQDDSKTVSLPFTFQYYGEEFDQVTICSNGWIAMGQTYLTNCRNWVIPGAGAPNYMIAPMWDNLYQSGNGRVYHWVDTANHRYIIQWSRVRNNYSNSTETFQVILYDPQNHETATGDGIIDFQYHTFVNNDSQQHYSTVGIQNGDMTDGVLYSYYNSYEAGAETITSGRAIRFMPIAALPASGTISGWVRNYTNGSTPIEGATVTLLETGDHMTTGPDGNYIGTAAAGIYTVTASHPSFEPDTVWALHINQGQTTTRNFLLDDIAPPQISGTTQYEHTMDEAGPYEINATIIEYSDLAELSLVYKVNSGEWISLPMTNQGGNTYAASIPGQPYTSVIRYYIAAEDAGGLTAADPPTAPEEYFYFWVMPPLLSDDIELGTGEWSHYVVLDGYNDQWHRSSSRNHTTGGSYSWKFGDSGAGDYTDLADGALESEVIALNGGAASLTFWHWMQAEESSSYPGYAYDGGLIEMSLDGGPWGQVTPEGGYSHLVRVGGTPGPFPADTPIFSGQIDWTQVTIDLEDISGPVQFRFRFGSDGSATDEGWYIDDVILIGDPPDLSDAEELAFIPTRTALYQNVPNPFGARGAGTRIAFDLPRSSRVRLQVYDAAGRLVRTLTDGTMPAGRHLTRWDGRDMGTRPVGSGVYFYVLNIDGRAQTRQMLVLR